MKKLLALLTVLTLSSSVASCSQAKWNERTLVVGMECAYAPFNWTDAEQNSTNVKITGGAGYCDGYDVAVAKMIADELNVELVIKKLEWKGLILSLNSGAIDVIIAGMSPTAERMQEINFTNDYFNSEQVIVVRADSPLASADSLSDFAGQTLVSQLGTIQDGLITDAVSTHGVVHGTAYATYPDAFMAVAQNTSIVGVVAEYPVARSVVNNNPNLAIVSFASGLGFTVADEDVLVSIGVRKIDTGLRDLINAFLENFTTEERTTLMDSIIARQPA